MLFAGNGGQILWGDGNWAFLDIGFSNVKRSCGLVVGEGSPQCFTFANARAEINREVARATALNLVIEAPLSVCFDTAGNPKRRSIEKVGLETRYWYTGPGCIVMVAAMHLISGFSKTKTPIYIFEGFVSYKDGSVNGRSHKEDVKALREAVKNPAERSVFEGDRLKDDPKDRLSCAFSVAGLDFGIPAVIKPNK